MGGFSMKGDHKHTKKAKGATGGGYARPRIQVGFDPNTIRDITKRAKQNDRSFAAEVRALVEAGLERTPKPWRQTAANATGG
jgi:hypothetical protein